MDPKTGEILAMVGSADWSNNEFGKVNMALALRQPGSAFKPIIYAAALEQRSITPASILDDKPTEFSDGYKPVNYDHKFRGKVTVRRALANSLNVPSVEVMQKVGVSRGVAFAKKLGLNSLYDNTSQYGLSLVLGAGEVPLLELTGAYSAFANEGIKYEPTAVLSITDKYGKEVTQYKPQPKNVLSKETAYLISSILSDNHAREEVFGNALTISRVAAVKTGTTTDYRDALTVGYTPSLVIGVWVGNNDNTPMDSVAGSLGAAPIWKTLMETYLQGKPKEEFVKPSTITQVTVCPYSGLNDPQSTTSGYSEYFVSGTQPYNPCPTPTPTDNPGSTPQPTPTPTSQPSNVATPTPSPTVSPLPTATPTAPPLPTPTSDPQIPYPTPIQIIITPPFR